MQAEALYREAERRFVELVNTFQDRLVTIPGLEALPLGCARTGIPHQEPAVLHRDAARRSGISRSG
jgi:hypothetical protein